MRLRWYPCLVLVAAGSTPSSAADPNTEFFESQIRPLLVEHCYGCHGPQKQKGGLRLDTREGVLAGGESGPAVVAGKPNDSRLIRAVRYTDADLRMPPKQQLKPEQVAALEKWVQLGVPDPRTKSAAAEAASEWDAVLKERRAWWSLQPVRKVTPPQAADANPIDRFIRAKLTAAGLEPAPPADRTILARRLSFVLTGLPPTPEQLAAYEADPAPDAYEKFVEALLASPHFGERWARHWLDVVRYADTYGYEWDVPARGAWRYRDYLVRAFNADVPFDQLTREQIAGDLLPKPRLGENGGTNEARIGPMFFMLGERRHGDSAMFNGIHQEMLHDQIDVFGRAFQAMTIGCARCHDHKLDAVSQRDYYALGGVLMSARWVTNTVDTAERNAATIARLKDLKGRLRGEVGKWWLRDGVSDGWKKLPAAQPTAAALPVEHPLHAWQAILTAARDQKDVAAKWKELATTYAKLAKDRTAANARDFAVVADFAKGVPAGWSVDGVGLRDGPVKSGDFVVGLDSDRVIRRVLPAGLFTDALSPRLNGVVRTPFLRQFDKPALSVRVAGGDFSAERVVVDNAFIAERQTYLTNPDPAWRRTSAFPEMKDRRVYVEYATKTSNPNFPPRWGLGPNLTVAQIDDPRSWFGITRVVAHSAAGTPADELGRFRSLFAGDAPKTAEEGAARYAAWFRLAVKAWSQGTADDEQAVLLNWLLEHDLFPNDRTPAPKRVGELLASYRAAEKELLDPQTMNGLLDCDPAEDYRLNARGDFDRPTVAVPRGYVGVFGRPPATGKSSGRLELAKYVASADNPLTARVYVNRVWHWVFGTGLVATPDDFGRLGEPPSHPELLDHLAGWFVEGRRGSQGEPVGGSPSGAAWSTKKLIRLLVTSRAFRQSGQATAAAVKADPQNRLLHHFPLRRLEAEPIRDSILAASGRLDRQLFGPPADPHRTAEDSMKRLFSGPLDGNGRRSIYTKVTIMEPPRFLAVFNQPPPKIATGRRDVTNVPAQALALLNDPFVVGQAKHWGDALVKASHRSVEERLRAMFRTALGRYPTTEELTRWGATVADLGVAHGVAADGVLASPPVWKDVAHALFNTKEFIYVR